MAKKPELSADAIRALRARLGNILARGAQLRREGGMPPNFWEGYEIGLEVAIAALDLHLEGHGPGPAGNPSPAAPDSAPSPRRPAGKQGRVEAVARMRAEGLDDPAIGELLGVSAAAVLQFRHRHGIRADGSVDPRALRPGGPNGRRRPKHTWAREEDLRLLAWRKEGKRYREIAALTGFTPGQLAQRKHVLFTDPSFTAYREKLEVELRRGTEGGGAPTLT